jgi:DUF1680 family protein
LVLILGVGGWLCPACQKQVFPDYPVQPVPFTAVRFDDGFWLPRIETNRPVTIPFAMRMNEETGRVRNFRLAAGREEGEYQGRRFNDTDIYKVIEGKAIPYYAWARRGAGRMAVWGEARVAMPIDASRSELATLLISS